MSMTIAMISYTVAEILLKVALNTKIQIQTMTKAAENQKIYFKSMSRNGLWLCIVLNKVTWNCVNYI